MMWYIFAAGYKWVHYIFCQESVDNKQTYTIERQKSMQKNAIDYVDMCKIETKRFFPALNKGI